MGRGVPWIEENSIFIFIVLIGYSSSTRTEMSGRSFSKES